ncbi:MAG: hypothetical protein ACFFD8_07180, partial [Candidatus Thorarchaeota archaeon]
MSPLSKDAKIGFAIVAIFLIVAAGVLISINLLAPREPPLTGELDVQVINGDTVLELDFDSLLTISATVPGATVEGASSYQNRFGNWRDAGTYAGIKLATIIELSGGMGVNDVIRVNASDGYAQYYSYANLYPNSTETTLQGDLILAYV